MKTKTSTALVTALKKKDRHTLETLLVIYSERLLHHSNQLWSIGAVFIPLSLSGVALGLGSPTQTMLVGAFSITLIWIWYLISLNLRDAIDQTYIICGSIETVLLSLNPPQVKRGLYELIPRKSLTRLKNVRSFIPIIVTFGWLVVIMFSFLVP